ncbi:MAG: nucleoside hydrolase, partial [Pseudomonas sp.]
MLKPLLQGLTLMAAAATTTLQAAPRELIIDTDPGADDVVALF